jgi:hypothetical protein
MIARTLATHALLISFLLVSCGLVATAATSAFVARECAVGLEYGGKTPIPSMRLRPACRLGLESTRAALAALLDGAPTDTAVATSASIYLGRIEEYPWLSAALAQAAQRSPQWNARRGRMREGNGRINRFVASLLMADANVQSLLPGWRLNAVSIEKVLIGPAERSLPGSGLRGKLPFDAMCWLRFQRDGTR